MIIDKNYWNNYYSINSETKINSSFSEFISSFLTEDDRMIELGCGDGRDAFYFAKKGLVVHAIDQSEEIIKVNKTKNTDGVFFHCADFTIDPVFLDRDQRVKHVYSRFTLHSINKIDFESTLDWIYGRLEVGGYFHFEVRSCNDPLFGVGESLGDNGYYSSHYRRFFSPRETLVQFSDRGFHAVIFVEDFLSANIETDKSVVIRAVFKKL
jgi:tellurite methyltransferase